MIRANIGNNAGRSNYNIPETYTVREALEEAGIDYSRGMISLDGSTIQAGDLNMTFEDMGFDGSPNKDRCVLSVLAKLDNA